MSGPAAPAIGSNVPAPTAIGYASGAQLPSIREVRGNLGSFIGFGLAAGATLPLTGTDTLPTDLVDVTITPQTDLYGEATSDGGSWTLSEAGEPGEPQSLFTSQVPGTPDATDGSPYEMGMKFQVDVAGEITAIRYYRAPSEGATTHTGRIWSAAGTQLASVVFASETASGWQEQDLASPLAIDADTTYVVSVNIGTSYAVTNSGLATAIVNGNIRSVDDGQNGVFGTPGTFPTGSFNEGNYFRDIVFVPDSELLELGAFSAGFNEGFDV